MKQVLFIAVGGGIGSVSRYLISRYINLLSGAMFPWGTLCVNFIGLFLIGFLFELFDRTLVAVHWRSFLTIGFLGGLTTFSTYGLETLNLFRDGELGLGLWNIVLSNIGGLLMVVIGIFAARIMFKLIS